MNEATAAQIKAIARFILYSVTRFVLAISASQVSVSEWHLDDKEADLMWTENIFLCCPSKLSFRRQKNRFSAKEKDNSSFYCEPLSGYISSAIGLIYKGVSGWMGDNWLLDLLTSLFQFCFNEGVRFEEDVVGKKWTAVRLRPPMN